MKRYYDFTYFNIEISAVSDLVLLNKVLLSSLTVVENRLTSKKVRFVSIILRISRKRSENVISWSTF